MKIFRGNVTDSIIIEFKTSDTNKRADEQALALLGAVNRMAYTEQSTEEDENIVEELTNSLTALLAGEKPISFAAHAPTCNWNTKPVGQAAWCICGAATGEYRPEAVPA